MSTEISPQPKTQIGNLKTGETRTRGALPFPEIPMDMELTPEDLSGNDHFPPTRFYDRDRRLTIQRELLRGNLQSLVHANDRVPRRFANLFYRVPQVHVNMLSLSPPQIDDPEKAQSALAAISACAFSMLAHGCAWLWADDKGMFWCFDAPRTYPVEDDGIAHVARYVSPQSTSSYPDMVTITRVNSAGVMQKMKARWNGGDRAQQDRENLMVPGVGGIGETTELLPPVQGAQLQRLCFGLPNGNWGTSMIDDMAGLVCDVADMYDLRSWIIEDQTTPLLTYRLANSEINEYQGSDLGFGDEDDWAASQSTFTRNQPNPSQEERIRTDILIQKAKGAIRLEDAIEDLEYIQADGNLADIESAIDQLHQELYAVHNLPSAFLSGDASGLSGESLKRLLLPFYAINAPLQRFLSHALNNVLGEEVVWPHIFDVLENDAGNMVDDDSDDERMFETDESEPEIANTDDRRRADRNSDGSRVAGETS